MASFLSSVSFHAEGAREAEVDRRVSHASHVSFGETADSVSDYGSHSDGGQLVPFEEEDTEGRKYCLQALGFRGSISPFNHQQLTSDTSWDFMFQQRGRKIGRAISASPHDEERRRLSWGNGGLSTPDPVSEPLVNCTSSLRRLQSKSLSRIHKRSDSVLALEAELTANPDSGLVRSPSMAQVPGLRRRSTLARKKSLAFGGLDVSSKPYLSITTQHTEALPTLLDLRERRVEEEAKERRDKELALVSLPHSAERLKKMAKPIHPQRQTLLAKRAYASALLRWAIGRVLVQVASKKTRLLHDAKKVLGEHRTIRDARLLSESNVTRGELAYSFFSDFLKRHQTGKLRSAKLTHAKYMQYRETFATICANTELSLTMHSLHTILDKAGHKMDASVFRKIDRDHSGSLEFPELLRVLFPSYPARELLSVHAKWEKMIPGVKTEQQKQSDNIARLSAESKQTIANIFKLCDRGRKGVLTRSDLQLIAPDEDWDSSEYFPTPTSVLTVDDFTELVKYGFPPFNGGGFIMEDLKPVEKRNPLPFELLAMQERTTSSL